MARSQLGQEMQVNVYESLQRRTCGRRDILTHFIRFRGDSK